MKTRLLLALVSGACMAFAPPPRARGVVSISKPPVSVRCGDRFDSMILRHSAACRLEPRLVKSIIAVESEFDPNAVSAKGALGLMQVMPATAEELGVSSKTLRNPEANVGAGTAYLRLLSRAWRSSREARQMADNARADAPMDRLVAAYHAGPGALAAAQWPPATQLYVRHVLRYYRSEQSILRPDNQAD